MAKEAPQTPPQAPITPEVDKALQQRLNNFNEEFIAIQRKYSIKIVCSLVYSPADVHAIPTAINMEGVKEEKASPIVTP